MSARILRRLSTVQLLILAVLLALVMPATLSGRDADAQTGDQLVGIEGSARAFGIFAHYNLGGVLPINSPVDSSVPDSFATISSGPATFAQAAVYNPGDLLANPDVLFQNFDPNWEPGTIPPYPYRISAQSGFGEPAADSSPAPGLQARVEAKPDGSSAVASAGRSDAPSILTTGAVTTTSTTSTDGATVTVRAVTEVTDVNVLDVLSIDSILTETTATSDGNDVVVSGSSSIGTATLAGQPVTIDGEGIHPGEGDDGDAPLLGGLLNTVAAQVSDLLQEAGITITAGGMVEQDGDETGRIAATGLRIEFDITGRSAPVLGELLGLVDLLDLPPVEGAPIQVADILEVVRGRNIVQLEVAGSGVSLAATLAPEIPEFTIPPTTPPPPPSTASPPPPPPTPTPAPVAPPTNPGPAPTEQATSAPAPASQVTVNSLAPGVGAVLVLALLLQPLLGLVLRRWTQAILAPGAAAGVPCDMEVPDV